MNTPESKGLNKMDDESLDDVAGGYIVYDPSDRMYVLVDDQYGQVKCRYNLLEMAQKDANGRNANGQMTKWAKECNDEVITIEQYEQLFGKKW